ncbi:MAG: hypothetical protein ISS28_01160 [Candidatus Cloacimonetes bacterium]|nr:hypothetical protein [Candidatus Cloacimonadota bacterium]
MEFKEIIIHIDGMDKTGKDSIRRELIRKSGGKYLVIVRSYISQLVYARLYNRKINESFFFQQMMTDYLNNIKFIILYTNKDKLTKRFITNDEQDLLIEDIDKHKIMFDVIVKEAEHKTGIKFIKINNTNEEINVTVNKIIEVIKKDE